MKSSRFHVAFILLPLLLLAAFPCRAEVREKTAYDYYDVDPGGKSLNEALIAAYPLQKPGERFHAYTRWHIDWRFEFDANGQGRCSMSEVETTLTVTMTLPRMESSAPAAMKRQFEGYFPKLKAHEDGHLKIAQNAANGIDTTLSAIRSVPCSGIAAQANASAYGILDRAVAAEKEYDLQTGHGRTQGAYLDAAAP